MIYKLTLLNHIDNFATVRIIGTVKAGHNIRFKNRLYKIVEVDRDDLYVIL